MTIPVNVGDEIMEKREAEHGRELLLDGYRITWIHFNRGNSRNIYGKDQAHPIYSDNFSGVVIVSDCGDYLDLIPMTSIEQIELEKIEEEEA